MTDLQTPQCFNNRKAWRKLVKKLRRKKIRQTKAIARPEINIDTDDSSNDEVSEYAKKERHTKWILDEQEAQAKWQEKEQIRISNEKEKQIIQEKIRKEWETARKQKLMKKEAEEKLRKEINDKTEDYIERGGPIPEALLIVKESNPGRDLCPFFSKVAACRFGPACSRNHVVPSISKTILIPNCYSHFTLEQNRHSEYDTDVSLEFDEKDMYNDFRDFFNDFTPELERLGSLQVVQVCRNGENHLRGNLYAAYADERSALSAACSLNARWYGGRQLSVTFVNIPDWGAAICGDFHRGRCPKGNQCNFLHTFKNPKGRLLPIKKKSADNERLHWRWSESPERDSSISLSRSPLRQCRQIKRERLMRNNEPLSKKSKSLNRSRSSRDSHRSRSSRSSERARKRSKERRSSRGSSNSQKEYAITSKMWSPSQTQQHVTSSLRRTSERSRSP